MTEKDVFDKLSGRLIKSDYDNIFVTSYDSNGESLTCTHARWVSTKIPLTNSEIAQFNILFADKNARLMDA